MAMAGDVVSTDVRVALEAERDELLAELSGVGARAGDHYDANFADSSQVTAERGEAEVMLGPDGLARAVRFADESGSY